MTSLISPRRRTITSHALRGLTASLAFAAAAGTGAVTALAAQASADDNAARAARKAAENAQRQAELEKWAAAHPKVVHVSRPLRTVVGPAVVRSVTSPGVARVGGSPSGSSRPPATSHGATTTVTPPPPPPPIPSTGS